MMIAGVVQTTMHIEAYTAGAVVSGAVGRGGGASDGFDGFEGFDPARPLVVEAATRIALTGGPAERRIRLEVGPDELVVVVPDDADFPIHASWHAVVIDAGPYRISGDLPTLPGFDPGRALTRPGGSFVLLRGIRLELLGRPDAGIVERAHGLVNRYAVDRVAADIDLGFFFPGAEFVTLAGQPTG